MYTPGKVRLIKRERREPADGVPAGAGACASLEVKKTVGGWVDEFTLRGPHGGLPTFESLFRQTAEEAGAEGEGSRPSEHAPGLPVDAETNIGGAGR
jgi:hypothetical protein